MYRYLLLLFFLVPLLEVWLLVQVGSRIGAWLLVLSILATAAIGAFFLRLQGFATLRRAQQSMLAGQVPSVEMVEGALLLFAGAMLLTPGYATDLAGFVLLAPQARTPLARGLLARYLLRAGQAPSSQAPDHAAMGEWHVHHGHARPGGGRKRAPAPGEVLEGEYTRED